MPFTTRDGTRLYWRLEGPTDRPPLVLLNAIGTDMALWDSLVSLLLPHFQILRFDARGHGASDAPPGDYSFEMLAHDVIAVMHAANLPRAAIAGVSLGGMIAMETALRFPEHVAALVLICTSARIDRALWVDRVNNLRAVGLAAIADEVMARFLSPQFSAAHPDRAASVRRTLLSTAGYGGAAAAIRDGELGGRLASIKAPTLIVSGNKDISMPFAPHSEALLAAIGGSTSARIDAGHLAPLEAPHALGQAIHRFLSAEDEPRRAARILYEAGIVNRRRVLRSFSHRLDQQRLEGCRPEEQDLTLVGEVAEKSSLREAGALGNFSDRRLFESTLGIELRGGLNKSTASVWFPPTHLQMVPDDSR